MVENNKIINILKGYGELTEGINFDVVTRYPLADESEILEKLGVEREKCDLCDVLWAFGGEIVFISFFSTFRDNNKKYVIYKFDTQAKNGGKHFNVATLKFPLERKHIEAGLNYLSKWLTDENNEILKMKPLEFVQITDQDIC